MDWEVWRIVSSERFSVSNPNEILTQWSMEDLLDAHLVLGLYEELERKAHQQQREAARKP